MIETTENRENFSLGITHQLTPTGLDSCGEFLKADLRETVQTCAPTTGPDGREGYLDITACTASGDLRAEAMVPPGEWKKLD